MLQLVRRLVSDSLGTFPWFFASLERGASCRPKISSPKGEINLQDHPGPRNDISRVFVERFRMSLIFSKPNVSRTPWALKSFYRHHWQQMEAHLQLEVMISFLFFDNNLVFEIGFFFLSGSRSNFS